MTITKSVEGLGTSNTASRMFGNAFIVRNNRTFEGVSFEVNTPAERELESRVLAAVSEANPDFYARLDRVNAVHEAGHAVAVMALGGEVVHVRIGDAWGGTGNCRSVGYSPLEHMPITLAGMAAEIILRGNVSFSFMQKSSGRADWKHFQQLLKANFPKNEHRAVTQKYKSMVLELLKEEWALVLRVTDALQEKRYLTGDTVHGMEA